MFGWNRNQQASGAPPRDTVSVDRGWVELAENTMTLLNAMLGHPVHGRDVERIVYDINPKAQFLRRGKTAISKFPILIDPTMPDDAIEFRAGDQVVRVENIGAGEDKKW